MTFNEARKVSASLPLQTLITRRGNPDIASTATLYRSPPGRITPAASQTDTLAATAGDICRVRDRIYSPVVFFAHHTSLVESRLQTIASHAHQSCHQ